MILLLSRCLDLLLNHLERLRSLLLVNTNVLRLSKLFSILLVLTREHGLYASPIAWLGLAHDLAVDCQIVTLEHQLVVLHPAVLAIRCVVIAVSAKSFVAAVDVHLSLLRGIDVLNRELGGLRIRARCCFLPLMPAYFEPFRQEA